MSLIKNETYNLLSKIIKFIDTVDEEKSTNNILKGGNNIENKQ